jgi:spore germination protein KB
MDCGGYRYYYGDSHDISIFKNFIDLSGQGLVDILSIAFGKFFGKVFALLYIWYAFHLGALVIRNFGEFINTVTLPETPMIVPMLFLGAVCIFAARSGVESMGRTSAYMLPSVMFLLVIVNILAIPQLKFSNLKPVLAEGLAPVIQGGFSIFSFPFAETILFIGVLFTLKTKKSTRRVYSTGIFFAGAVILLLSIRNVAILGELREKLYFPSHVVVSRISVGAFLQRIEVSVAFTFAVCAFVKGSVCLFVASKGISKVFNLNDYRSVVIQTGLLMTLFAYTVYDNIMDMRYWAFKVYSYYAFPFQVIIPLIIWVVLEVKREKSQLLRCLDQGH